MESCVNKKYPKVLVFSNNSFSKSSANGRTLGNLFKGWPKENLAQFCISTNGPDFNLCDNYYCISDKSALRAFLSFTVPRRTIFENSKANFSQPDSFKRNPKTPFRMLIRNAVWSFCRWKSDSLLKWIYDFSPNIIVVMSGDSFFFLNMARNISESLKVPLVIFNTEGYYLFESNYMWKGDLDMFFFPIYQKIYRFFFKRLMKVADYTVYSNSLLKKDYDVVFGGESDVIYTGTSINNKIKQSIDIPPRFSYLGNFGFRRYETLLELSEVLHDINPSYRLDVYGDASPDVIDILKDAPYVDYKGLISYDEVLEVMHQSDILFHVENQAEDLQMSLKYGFSTKIADSIASGTLFCLYASPEIACSKYIKETQAGLYANDRDELKNKIVTVIKDNRIRLDIIQKGYKIASQNHNLERNAEKMRAILAGIVERS